MMKKQILLLAALAVLAGCAEQMEPVEGLGGKLTAHIGDAETRVSFDESSGKFSWTAGDQIDVHTTAGYKTAELDVNGCFSLERGSVRDGYAIYPTGIVSGTSDLTLQLPASYDVAAEGMVDFYPSPMVALNDPAADDIWFYHAGAVARLVFAELPAETRTIVVTLDQRITGTFAVADPGTDNPVIATDGTATGTSVTFNLAGAPAANFALNVPIPTGTYNSISVSIQDASNAEIDSKVSNKVRKFPRARGRKIVFDGDEVTEYTLILEGPTSALSASGDNGVITITSYKSNSSGDTWVDLDKIEYSLDGGSTWSESKPRWLRFGDMTPSSDGLSQANNIEVLTNWGVSSKTWDGTSSYDESVVTDLSLQDIYGNSIAQSTANCYVVSAPGWYKFPAVYGNALKNGETNEVAYKNVNPAATALNSFVRHDDQPIVAPWIKDNGITIADACLLWQDSDYLVSDVSFAEDYITFFVDPETIFQGNAVIAARNASGTIVWSWHIWVMDSPTTKLSTKKVYSTYDYTDYRDAVHHHESAILPLDLMDMNLGWCEGEDIEATPRSVKVKVTQAISGLTAVADIDQAANEAYSSYGNAPFYQWGRKDPMLPAKGDKSIVDEAISGIDWTDDLSVFAKKNQFYENDALKWQINADDSGVTVGGAIQQANFFIQGSMEHDPSHWCIPYATEPDGDSFRELFYTNLWNAYSRHDPDNQEESSPAVDVPVIKTVYDPCPVGFTVPNQYAFIAFAGDFREWDDANQQYRTVNIINAANLETYASDYGYNYWCDPYGLGGPAKTETTFFPISGIYLPSGQIGFYSNFSGYWTASTVEHDFIGSMFGCEGEVGTFDFGGQPAFGMFIRPVKETDSWTGITGNAGSYGHDDWN